MEEEFPTKLAEIGTFNLDSLLQILKLLHDENMNLSKKIENMDDIKQQLGDLQIKTKKLENQNKEINESFQNLQSKVLERDTRMGIINQKQIEIEESLGRHDDNINKLNKVVEEHIKNTHEFENKLRDVTVNNNNMEQIINKMEHEFEDYKNDTGMNLGKDIDNLKSELTELNQQMIKKFSEIDKSFANIKKGIQYNIDMNKKIIPEKKGFDE